MNSVPLNDWQKQFLKLFGAQKKLSDKFYLTGGTALNAFYLPYRLSEDLDFFSEKEVDTREILSFLRSAKNKLDYQKFDFNTAFNRNIIVLFWPDYELKLEFTYFPFPQIEKPKKDVVLVDSVVDIAVNKVFTIYQKPRSRDFMDLYMIHKKYGLVFEELIKKAKIKFDWHIDPVKLGSQMLLARQLKDYPKLLVVLQEKDWQGFFVQEAKKLDKKIFE